MNTKSNKDGQPEQKLNSEQTADNISVSPAIGNTNVSGCAVKCDECNGTGEVERNIHHGEEGMQIEMDVMVVCSQCEGTGLADIEDIAFKEFENVGDEGLFPNHTDKDIWVNGFKAGVEYCFSNSR